MKATRRQELRSNELMHGLYEVRDFLRKYATHITIGVIAVAAVFVVVFYMKESARQQLAEASQELNSLKAATDDEARSSLKRIAELTGEISDESFVLNALGKQSAIAMSRAHAAEDGTPSREFLDKAREGYEKIRDRFSGRTLEVATALYGLATIEMDMFVLDGDSKHKDKCRALLEELASQGRFNALPFQDLALQRINTLDDVFVTVALADAPAGTPTDPALPQLEGDDGVKIVPVSPEEVPDAILQQAAERMRQSAAKRAGEQQSSPPPDDASKPETTEGDPSGEAGESSEKTEEPAEPSDGTQPDPSPEP